MNPSKEPAPVVSARPAACQPDSDKVKIDSTILEQILSLSKREYEVFRELGQGWEIDEIAEHLKKDINAIYSLVWRMRPKLGIKTIAMLRFEATRFVLSGVKRQARHFKFAQSLGSDARSMPVPLPRANALLKLIPKLKRAVGTESKIGALVPVSTPN